MTPNGEHKKNGPVRSWRRVKILTPRHLCENPNCSTGHPKLRLPHPVNCCSAFSMHADTPLRTGRLYRLPHPPNLSITLSLQAQPWTRTALATAPSVVVCTQPYAPNPGSAPHFLHRNIFPPPTVYQVFNTEHFLPLSTLTVAVLNLYSGSQVLSQVPSMHTWCEYSTCCSNPSAAGGENTRGGSMVRLKLASCRAAASWVRSAFYWAASKFNMMPNMTQVACHR